MIQAKQEALSAITEALLDDVHLNERIKRVQLHLEEACVLSLLLHLLCHQGCILIEFGKILFPAGIRIVPGRCFQPIDRQLHFRPLMYDASPRYGIPWKQTGNMIGPIDTIVHFLPHDDADPLDLIGGIHILLEPINHRDMPGYFLNRQDQAHALIAEIGAANVKVQMDLYHAQITEGDLAMKIRQYIPTGQVGHFQIAGVPERHEPDVGEVHYPYLFTLLDSLGYGGWIGCEYRPARGAAPHATSDGLGWLQPWL